MLRTFWNFRTGKALKSWQVAGEGIYMDKTRYIHQLFERSGYYFLSRPRCFGKSLLTSTAACLFEGRQELVSGGGIKPPLNSSRLSNFLRILNRRFSLWIY
jgi:hypothetical protein